LSRDSFNGPVLLSNDALLYVIAVQGRGHHGSSRTAIDSLRQPQHPSQPGATGGSLGTLLREIARLQGHPALEQADERGEEEGEQDGERERDQDRRGPKEDGDHEDEDHSGLERVQQLAHVIGPLDSG
jgi:hypothetical protein